MKKKLSVLHFDSHHAIERFGMLVSVLLILSIILSVTTIAHVVKTKADTLNNKAIYTEKFTSSLSSTKGEVRKIYANKNKTDCFVLLKFESTDNISTDAKDYKLFLTGSDTKAKKEELKSHPGATIYMFGTTGFMGIHLFSESGFPQQVLSLTVRCTNQLTVESGNHVKDDDKDNKNNSSDSNTSEYADASFAKHDQFRIYFNPAATEAELTDFLDAPKMDVKRIYYNIAVADREHEVDAKLDEQLAQMATQLNLIDEYARRLDIDDNMQIPELPAEIKGDNFVAKNAQGKILTKKSDVWKDDEGNTVPNDEVLYYFKPGKVLDGGVDFTWQDSNVFDGYFKQIYNGENYAAYLDSITATTKSTLSTKEFRWFKKDGSEFKYSASGGTSRDGNVKDVQNDISKYVKALEDYFGLKQTYESELLIDLLDLELECHNAYERRTSNDALDVITLY